MLEIMIFRAWLRALGLNLIQDESKLQAQSLKVEARAFRAFEQLVYLWAFENVQNWPAWWSSLSRSEQAPESEFHPRDETEKYNCVFLGPSWCNKKVNPETYVLCGSYELLMSNVAHQMKEKFTIQNKFSHFLSQISLKFEICSFFSGSKTNKKKTSFERNCKLHFLPRVSCQLEFHFSCRLYLHLASPDDVLSKTADLSHYFKCQKKYEFESNFFKTPI